MSFSSLSGTGSASPPFVRTGASLTYRSGSRPTTPSSGSRASSSWTRPPITRSGCTSSSSRSRTRPTFALIFCGDFKNFVEFHRKSRFYGRRYQRLRFADASHRFFDLFLCRFWTLRLRFDYRVVWVVYSEQQNQNQLIRKLRTNICGITWEDGRQKWRHCIAMRLRPKTDPWIQQKRNEWVVSHLQPYGCTWLHPFGWKMSTIVPLITDYKTIESNKSSIFSQN